MQNRHRAAERRSLAALLRDLRLSLAADDPLLCDCDASIPQHECD
jgi:hypothetical protein